MLDVFDIDPAKMSEITKILEHELKIASAMKDQAFCNIETYGDAEKNRPFIHTISPRNKNNTNPYIMCIQFKGHQIRLYTDGTWGWECTAISKEALATLGIVEEEDG